MCIKFLYILHSNFLRYYFYPHFADENIEIQRKRELIKVTKLGTGLGHKPGSLAPERMRTGTWGWRTITKDQSEAAEKG